MPSIPSTRQKTFKSSKEDAIQWSLTNHHSKTYLETTICKYSKSKSTLDVAKKFIKLLNNANNESDKITEIIKDITCLYQTISFNSKQFLEYIFEHATSSNIRILVLYSKIVSQLQVLALSTRLILSYVPHLDETLIRLISFEENEIAEVYIHSIQKDIRHKLIMKGGRQLVNWNESMQIDHVKFMLYLLKQEITFEDRHLVLVQLLKLSNMGTTTTQDMYHNLQKVKTNVFITQHTNKFITRLPILQHLSNWFFEFNPDSNWKLIDLILHSLQLNSISDETLDLYFLLYIYQSGCQELVMNGNDVIRISDIIQTLNEGIIKSLEKGEGQELILILTLAQFVLEQMYGSVGYSYANWFDTTFTHQRMSVLLNKKKASMVFIKTLQEMIPYELPSLLQIHGRSLQNCSTDIVPQNHVYVSATKKRLLELGVNSSLKSYPSSLKKPIPPSTTTMTESEDKIKELIQQFIKKGGIIPTSLLQSHVFRRQWFISTFLPKLLAWEGKEMEAKHQFILALKEKQKIPDTMFTQYIEKKK